MLRVANAPCSWGSLEFEGLAGESIGYEQMLDELVETGYVGTELGDWGYMPTDPNALHQEMAERDLTLVGAFVPVALAGSDAGGKGLEEALRTARLLAAVAEQGGQGHSPFLVLADDNGTDPVRTQHAGRVTPELALSEEQWTLFAQNAESIARTIRSETGLPVVFHHHCAGFVETPDEIARLLDMTDPEALGLVLDTGHYLYGSGTNDAGVVLDGLHRFADRIRHLHFKDCHRSISERARNEGADYFEAVRRGVFCELGQGEVDFRRVIDWARHTGYEGWVVVEQDVLPGMGTPKESARRNRAFLRGLGL